MHTLVNDEDDDHLPLEINSDANEYRYKNHEIVVFDVVTNKPIKNANVYLYEYKYNKLVTDLSGSSHVADYKKTFEKIYTCKPNDYSNIDIDG